MTETQQATASCRCVRVWFGKCVICELVAAPDAAADYEAAMLRRFAGLRVTNESISAVAEQVGATS